MNYVRKAFSALGGIFLAALLIGAFVPKATRGVAAALVQVVNTPSDPVATAEALGAATILDFECDDFSNLPDPGNYISSACFTVPQGKRALVENLDGSCFSPNGFSVSDAKLLVPESHQIPLQFQGITPFGFANYSFNLPVRIYVDPGHAFGLQFTTSDNTQQSGCFARVSGRLVPTS